MRIVKCHAGIVYTQNCLSYSHVVLLTRRAIHYHIQLLMCTMPCPTHDFLGTLIMCPAHALKCPVKWAESKKDGNKWEGHALWKWYFHWPVWMSFWVMTIGYLQKIHVTAWVCRDRSFKQPVLTWSCLVCSFVLHTRSLLLLFTRWYLSANVCADAFSIDSSVGVLCNIQILIGSLWMYSNPHIQFLAISSR